MLTDFLTYIREQSLFQKKEYILLAMSSGIDSVVLAHLFHQAGFNFGMAHVNFSLRSEDSDADQSFAEDLSKRYNVPYHTVVFDTNAYAAENKISTQMAARDLRYNWFEELRNNHDYQYIATAHHLTDSIETVLFNFSKGTGISGMRGIQSKNAQLIRPLLFASKKEISAYARAQKLVWREDKSNASDKYHRNHIRHHILPQLDHINPSFENTSKSTLERMKDAEEIVLSAVEAAKDNYHQQDGQHHIYPINALRKLGGSTTILHHLIKHFGFNYSQSKNMLKQMDQAGKLFLSATHQANIDRAQLIISPLKGTNGVEFLINLGDTHLSTDEMVLNISQEDVPQVIPIKPSIGCFDMAKISFPLTIRTWQHGDKFHPLGMTKQKKVSDLLIDTKVPINLKEEVKVLLSNNEIVWVMGHRISDQFKITATTTDILQIEIK
jgi:tRNA(Ile)-lysidine synthase